MSTTTLITVAPTGRTIAKAFTKDTDTLAANGTATSLVYGSTNTNLLTIVWTDLADGDYDFILTNAGGSVSSDVLRVSGVTAILLGDRTTAELDSAAKLVLGALAAQHFGAIANAQSATETYVATAFGQTFTVTHSGATATGNRSEAARVAS